MPCPEPTARDTVTMQVVEGTTRYEVRCRPTVHCLRRLHGSARKPWKTNRTVTPLSEAMSAEISDFMRCAVCSATFLVSRN